MLNFIRSGKANYTVNIDGESYCVRTDHPNYSQVIEALKNKDEEAIIIALDIRKAMGEYASGDIEVSGNSVYYRGHRMSGYITDRILEQMSEGFGHEPMCSFLDNFMDNPEPSSIDQLYPFLENNGLVLTDDGHFLAYKYVYEDGKGGYRPGHPNKDGSYNNTSPGVTVQMPRSEVTLDPARPCASGLHVGSPDYVSGSNTIMLVKVNPKHAVSVPNEHGSGKLRCCEYHNVRIVNLTKEESESKTSFFYQKGLTNVGQDGISPSKYAAKGSLDNPVADHWN